MINRFILYSPYGSDNFFQSGWWIYRIKINDYQLMTIFWNLLLIAVPYFLSYLLISYWDKSRFEKLYQKLAALILSFFWLIFIPNTAYIITEVRHLFNFCPLDAPFAVCETKAWIIMFFFSYAAVGWVSFYYLVDQMKSLTQKIFGRRAAFFFLILIVPLSALGVLLGLFHRWNSWELFIYPLDLLKNITLYFSNGAYFRHWLTFSAFLYLLYGAGKLVFKDKFSGKKNV